MPKRKRAQSLQRSVTLSSRSARRHPRRPMHRGDRAGVRDNDGNNLGDLDAAVQASSTGKSPQNAIVSAAIVSILIGSSIAILTIGLVSRLGPLLGRQPTPQETVMAAVLLLIALGIKIPHQLAMWVSMSAWRRFLSQGLPVGTATPLDPRFADPSRDWVLLAVVALLAGVATALTPIVAQGVMASYGWLQDHFVWSLAPLVLLRALAVLVTGLVPLTVFGLAISTAHRLSCPFSGWDTRASAWLLIGAAIGVWIADTVGLAGRSPDLCLTAAALPALAACLIATASCSPDARRPVRELCLSDGRLPLWSDRWPTLLRASIVAVSSVGAWVICLRCQPTGQEHLTHAGLAGMLVAAGVGIRLGCVSRGSKIRSIGGFGIACCVAGIVLATSGLPSGGLDDALIQEVTCYLDLGAIGFAAAYGRQALLARVATRSSTGSVMLVRVLIGCAFVVWVGAPVVGHVLSGRTAQAASALFLLALGGTLIVHEPTSSLRTRAIRVSAVFCAIAIMICWTLYPPSP